VHVDISESEARAAVGEGTAWMFILECFPEVKHHVVTAFELADAVLVFL